jgi:hypothetical protein
VLLVAGRGYIQLTVRCTLSQTGLEQAASAGGLFGLSGLSLFCLAVLLRLTDYVPMPLQGRSNYAAASK